MDNIFIFSDNSYIREAMPLILQEIKRDAAIDGELSIFLFEKIWLNETELSMILNTNSERIIILARESLLDFFSALMLPKNISFGHFDISLTKMRAVLASLIYKSTAISLIHRRGISPRRNKLSPVELKITSLYMQGVSLTNIAKGLNRSFKTISAQKRSAMKKMGIASNVELMQNGRLFLMMNKEFILT